ncbi:uncharacterized protein LOC114528709 [Dendronephthya gigantea]|uniref:uncharacterized protein LOC114528709 n=1 Tax=Dendronephthya gigantea TaxID=151771 RepID=UPI00106AAF84|nr:uncharacterized protein LOC114528709 [Dendronephthya gigantea]
MGNLFLLQWLVFLISATKHSFCLPADHKQNMFTFFKKSIDLPGPTMSFKETLVTGIFEFEFKTFVEHALLLYQDDQGINDYLRITISGGKIELTLGVGSVQPPSFVTEMLYNDLKWHKIRIQWNTTHFKLIIDGKLMKVLSIGPPNLTSHMHLGGLAKRERDSLSDFDVFKIYFTSSGDTSKRGYFFGCVRKIKYGNSSEANLLPISDIPSQRFFVTEGNCTLTVCDMPRVDNLHGNCDNKGVCKPDGKGSATCDCRWTGYEGPTCTEDALRLILNGSYKIAYKPQVSMSGKQQRFSLRIRTSQENAIILAADVEEGRSDSLKMEIKDSRFVVTSGGNSLNSNVTVTDNKWHFVSFRRDEKTLSLNVDEIGVSRKSDSNINYNVLYIGEKSSRLNKTIEIEDFIWEYQNNEINFIKEVYASFGKSSSNYKIVPDGIMPLFNKKMSTNVTLSTTFTPMDGCKMANKKCHSNAYCSENGESFDCVCKTGFSGNGSQNCADIDECTRSPCHERAQCINTNGSYKCLCEPGLSGDGHHNCSDIDECAQTPAPCLSECNNTIGSYLCRCPSGFTGDGKHNCTDIDECATNGTCKDYEQCKNTEGSYTCVRVCDPGYHEGGEDNCEDIDECVQSKTICHHLATCINTPGSFSCQCPRDHDGDGISTCVLSNPCDLFPCFRGLNCVEVPNGNYSCEECPPPYFIGDGKDCARNKSSNVVSKKTTLVLRKEKWTDELKDKSSDVYKTLESRLTKKIRKIYENHPEFVYALINKFRKGSVLAELEVLFKEDLKEPFEPLKEAIKNGDMRNMTLEIREPVSATDDSKTEKIVGLKKAIFISIVSLAAGVCILGVTMVVFLLILQKGRRQRAKIDNGGQEKIVNTTEPQGLLYKTSADEANGDE